MVIGTDTYVTVAEADAHIASHYLSSDPGRIRWTSLSDGDKENLLVNACAELEQLPFHGRKADPWQLLAFPRLPLRFGYPIEVPAKVKQAQIELALWLSDTTKQSELTQRKELQVQGVQLFGLGDLSESYTGSGIDYRALAYPKVAQLLSAYLNGGYCTC